MEKKRKIVYIVKFFCPFNCRQNNEINSQSNEYKVEGFSPGPPNRTNHLLILEGFFFTWFLLDFCDCEYQEYDEVIQLTCAYPRGFRNHKSTGRIIKHSLCVVVVVED